MNANIKEKKKFFFLNGYMNNWSINILQIRSKRILKKKEKRILFLKYDEYELFLS